MSTLETARGSGPIFLHPAAPACESGTTVQLRSSFGHHCPLRRMYQAVRYLLNELLYAHDHMHRPAGCDAPCKL